MKQNSLFDRRFMIKSSVFGLFAVNLPQIVFAKEMSPLQDKSDKELFHRYPSIDDEIVAEVVGKSHFNFERVKELVDPRPELARATWDWSFGDWETALGAASHVGRRDIALYLMSKGARADLFTHAMLGHIDVVKTTIAASPGIQTVEGPHGISLLRHAKSGLRDETLSEKQKDNSKRLIEYLEELGDAETIPTDLPMSAETKERYLGDYMYGDGPSDGLSVKQNMRDMLTLGKLGNFGGGLFQKSPNVFTYNGIHSVEIHFEVVKEEVVSLTIHEPDLILQATKIQ